MIRREMTAWLVQGPVSRKSQKLFGSEKPSAKLRPACSVKLVFPHDVMGSKIKITVQFRVLERLRFQDTKRIMSPEKFRDFRETGTSSPAVKNGGEAGPPVEMLLLLGSLSMQGF